MNLNIKKIVVVSFFFLVLSKPLIATENSQEKKKNLFSRIFRGIKNKIVNAGESTGKYIRKVPEIPENAPKSIETVFKKTGEIWKVIVKESVTLLNNIIPRQDLKNNPYEKNNPYDMGSKDDSAGEKKNNENLKKEKNVPQITLNKEEEEEKKGEKEESLKEGEKEKEEKREEKVEKKEKITNLEINEESICCWC